MFRGRPASGLTLDPCKEVAEGSEAALWSGGGAIHGQTMEAANEGSKEPEAGGGEAVCRADAEDEAKYGLEAAEALTDT